MGYYIVATKDGDEERYRPPRRAPNPEEAVYRRGVIPEDYDEVTVYQITETPTGDCKYWDKDDLYLMEEDWKSDKVGEWENGP